LPGVRNGTSGRAANIFLRLCDYKGRNQQKITGTAVLERKNKVKGMWTF